MNREIDYNEEHDLSIAKKIMDDCSVFQVKTLKNKNFHGFSYLHDNVVPVLAVSSYLASKPYSVKSPLKEMFKNLYTAASALYDVISTNTFSRDREGVGIKRIEYGGRVSGDEYDVIIRDLNDKKFKFVHAYEKFVVTIAKK